MGISKNISNKSWRSHRGVCSSLEGVKNWCFPCTGISVFSRVPNTSFLENLIFLSKKWFQRKNVFNTKDVFFYALQLLFETFFQIPIIYENKWKKPWFYGFFMVFVIEFKFAPIFIMIFAISAWKYVHFRNCTPQLLMSTRKKLKIFYTLCIIY